MPGNSSATFDTGVPTSHGFAVFSASRISSYSKPEENQARDRVVARKRGMRGCTLPVSVGLYLDPFLYQPVHGGQGGLDSAAHGRGDD